MRTPPLHAWLLVLMSSCALQLDAGRGEGACGRAGERCCDTTALAGRSVGALATTGCEAPLTCAASVCAEPSDGAAGDATLDADAPAAPDVAEVVDAMAEGVGPDLTPPPDAPLDAALDASVADAVPDVFPVDAAPEAGPDVAPDLPRDATDPSEVWDATDATEGTDARDASEGGDVRDAPAEADVADVPADVCASPRMMCGGACVDTATSALHCGGCGRPCAVAEQCRSGRCVACGAAGLPTCAVGGCLSGLTACTGVCRDTRVDVAHCGGCDRVCAAGRSCLAGACTTCGAAGQMACGTSCNARLTVCSGVCRDLQSDAAHCGACGNACGASALCRAATCIACGRAGQASCAGVCNARLTACADTCRDLDADASHCGACGRSCDPGAACVAGMCRPQARLHMAYLASFARVADGTFRAWGLNAQGQLADGTTVNRATPSATRLAADTTSVVGGSQHGCALRADGTVQCWGANANGQLGDDSPTTLTRATPAPVPGLTAGVSLAAGTLHTCAARSDGAVRCWGANANAQLGTGDTRNRTSPAPVVGLTGSFVEVAAGLAHSCARRADGAVFCWGSNTNGELGDGPSTRTAPLQVPGIVATAVYAGGQNSCALLAGGALRCWGANRFGQVGDGSSVNRNAPVVVRTAGPVVDVHIGATFTCALLATGSVQCWGYNGYGALGDGTTANRSTPTNVTGLTGVTELSGGGGGHTCARVAAGVRCWGYNANGQLGDGSGTNRTSPVPLPGV